VTSFTAARSGTVDDVVVSVQRVDLDHDLAALRLQLTQLAVGDKNYVDLGPRDAIWLAYAILRGAEELFTD
jgi:hypothetical protein